MTRDEMIQKLKFGHAVASPVGTSQPGAADMRARQAALLSLNAHVWKMGSEMHAAMKAGAAALAAYPAPAPPGVRFVRVSDAMVEQLRNGSEPVTIQVVDREGGELELFATRYAPPLAGEAPPCTCEPHPIEPTCPTHGWMPTGPAAPEAMPEIQVGDVLLFTSGTTMLVDVRDAMPSPDSPAARAITAIYRDPLGRRPVEPPPAHEKET